MKGKVTGLLAAAAIVIGIGPARAEDHLKMIMNWTADSAHLGFAMAEVQGIYQKAGLKVDLEEGRGSAVAAQLVATGQADVGLADAGAIINVASKGAPLKIISTIWKAGQFGIISLDKTGLKTPADLKGKKVAVAPGSAQATLFPLLLKANGLSPSDVTVVSANQNAFIGLLTSGEVAAVAETPENVVVPLAANGVKADTMYFFDYGVPLVSLSLVAREDKLAASPDVYKRFVQATAEGWKAAMENPDAAADALLKVFPDVKKSKADLLKGATYSFKSVCPAGKGDAIGATKADTWTKIYDVMTGSMGLSKSKPITDYYTLDFVPNPPVTCP